MSCRVEAIKAFAEVGFMRLGNATKDLKPEQLDWQSCKEANTIRWILTHLSSELHSFIPKVVKGDKNYEPKGWPKDYVGNKGYSLEKIMKDIEDGKKSVAKLLGGLKDEDLKKEMDWFYGKKPMDFYLMLSVSEIIHHEGQIAAILGVEKRMKGT